MGYPRDRNERILESGNIPNPVRRFSILGPVTEQIMIQAEILTLAGDGSNETIGSGAGKSVLDASITEYTIRHVFSCSEERGRPYSQYAEGHKKIK